MRIGQLSLDTIQRNRRQAYIAAGTTILLACFGQAVHAQEAPFTLSVDTDNRVNLRAAGVAPKLLTSPSNVDGSIQGTESSQCVPVEERKSASSAHGQAKVLSTDSSSVSITLASEAYAQGGHYRTCDGCLASTCVGIHGNDTTGYGLGEARAVTTIKFSATYEHLGDYELLVGTRNSGGASVSVTLQDGNHNPIPLKTATGESTTLHGIPGAVYYVAATLSSEAQNAGGCCNQSVNGDASVNIQLRKAPILATGYSVGYIRGGKQTTAYKNVGAIVLRGAMHCTGTLIGLKTVLTAAHCLQGYENQVSDMRFVLGSNYQYPDVPPLEVSDMAYPLGGAGEPHFNPQTFEDDIGIVHLKTAPSVSPAALYQGEPSWTDVQRLGQSLIFVGFGYNVIAGDQVGLGIKREGDWKVDKVENKKFDFSVPGQNTCFGDSGGPAFIESQSALMLAGITSSGDDACTFGSETRVDAYATWLSGRVH